MRYNSSRRLNGRNKECKHCTMAFVDTSKQNSSKYCSVKCKKLKNARVVLRDKNCKMCGNAFTDFTRFNSEELCSSFCKKEFANSKRYGISKEYYLKLLSVKNCQICLKVFNKRNDSHIDHCHLTGKVRGVLCRVCNTSLGGLGDSIEGLKRAINYLEGK